LEETKSESGYLRPTQAFFFRELEEHVQRLEVVGLFGGLA